MEIRRFAIYYLPRRDAAWARYCTAWLGWDIHSGMPVDHPPDAELDLDAITETPRRYGLHATLKPPFRLAEGKTAAALQTRLAALAASQPPVRVDRLEITRLGRFLALCPEGGKVALNSLAGACVRELDDFRAPAPEDETERRRAAGLTPEQEQNLRRWGYPYVMQQFRFHITLTGKLGKPMLPRVAARLERDLAPHLPRPLHLSELALVGEAENGYFHLISRHTLSG